MSETTNPKRTDSPLLVGVIALSLALGALVWGTLNQPAHAEMVSESGQLVAMTAAADDEDLLYVLDNRAESLMVYQVSQDGSMNLLQSVDLPEYFQAARTRSLGAD